MYFELCGVRIGLGFSFFAVLLVMVLQSGSDWPLWCVLCCLIHELGHGAAYALCGSRPKEIRLEAGGMRIIPPERLFRPGQEAFVLLGGILANLLSAAVLLPWGAVQAAGIHLFLAAFNLLPLAPLDGGQLLAILLRQILPPETAERTACGIHRICLILLIGIGIFLLVRYGNFTLLLTLLCLKFA